MLLFSSLLLKMANRTKVNKEESIKDYFSRVIRLKKREVDMNDLHKHRKRSMGSNRQ